MDGWCSPDADSQLTLATLGGVGAIAFASTRGGGSKAKTAEQQAPPINAASSDEEAFIKQFIAEAEAQEKGKPEYHTTESKK